MTDQRTAPVTPDTDPGRLARHVYAKVLDLLAECPACRERAAYRADVPDLSPRQLEVVAMLAEGLTIDQIARRLFITSATARSHAKRVREILGVHSNTHAVAVALRAGLIQ